MAVILPSIPRAVESSEIIASTGTVNTGDGEVFGINPELNSTEVDKVNREQGKSMVERLHIDFLQ